MDNNDATKKITLYINLLVCHDENVTDAANARLDKHYGKGKSPYVAITAPDIKYGAFPPDVFSAIIWPTTTSGGKGIAKLLARKALSEKIPVVRIVSGGDLPLQFADGWTLADKNPKRRASIDGASVDYTDAMIIRMIEDAVRVMDQGIIPLGTDDHGHNYYRMLSTSGVRRLSPSAHDTNNFLAMEDNAWWLSAYPKMQKNAETGIDEVVGIDMHKAKGDLMKGCRERGEYDELKERPTGIYKDAGTLVANCGDHLVVDFKPISIGSFASRKVYKPSTPIHYLDRPATAELAAEVGDIFDCINWKSKEMAWITAGWTAMAPFCDILPWRPHMWITGESNLGKSTIIERLIEPLGAGLISIQSADVTEPGIRMFLKGRAISLIIDESERDTKKGEANQQAHQNFARLACNKLPIRKWAGPKELLEYIPVSMVCFSSTNPQFDQAADENRTLIVERAGQMDTTDEWLALVSRMDAVSTAGPALIGRMISIWGQVEESMDVFSEAVQSISGDSRRAQVYGPLLAGAWHYRSNVAVTGAEADEWVKQIDFTSDRDRLSDQENLFGMIMSHQIYYSLFGRPDRKSVETLILRAAVGNDDAHRTLRDIGILVHGWGKLDFISLEQKDEALRNKAQHKLETRIDNMWVRIADTHSGLESILKDTRYPKGWRKVLSRLPHAVPTTSNSAKAKFTGISARYVAFKLTNLYDIDLPMLRAEQDNLDKIEKENTKSS